MVIAQEIYNGKRLGIMQPYFFPYIGYYGLIANTDRWIVFDPVQFKKKSWMTRNRILKAGGGQKYINLQVAPPSRFDLIKDINLRDKSMVFDDLVRNLDAYKLLRAPHYNDVVDLLHRCCECKEDSLVKFLTHCLIQTCLYIGIPFRCEIYSEMNLKHTEPLHPMDWSLYICQTLGVAEYINPPGGRDFFDINRFEEAGIKFYYYEHDLTKYNQKIPEFIAGLSIIDVLMFNSPNQVRNMLTQYCLLEI